MLCVPNKRELPLVEAGDEPPKMKSVLPLAETLMAHAVASNLPDKYSEIAIGTIADIFSRLIGISSSMHLIVREGIRPFFREKQLTKNSIFRALMYAIANAGELKAGNVVPSINAGLPLNVTVWQLIQVVDLKHIANTDKGSLYSVSFIVLTAPLAGSIFTCKISGKQIKRLIRDNSSCKFDPHVIPEFIFGYRLMGLLRTSEKGMIIQTTFPSSSCVAYNVKIKKARQNCKVKTPCIACYKGVDKCRFAVKKDSWPLVVCPYCLQDAYACSKITTTCKCYKENYRDRE